MKSSQFYARPRQPDTHAASASRNPPLGTILVLFFFLLALFGAQLAPYPNPNDQGNDVRVSPTLDLGRAAAR